MLQLFSGPISMFGAKVQIALIEKAIPFELTMVSYELATGYEPKHPEVVRINPSKRQVPVLIDGSLELFDSTQIFEYLEDLKPEPPLWPRDIAARARARLLEHRSDEIYFPHVIRLFGLRDTDNGGAATRAEWAGCAAHCADMEAALAGGDYLAGAWSFADIAFYLAQLYGERHGAVLTEATPRLLAWRDRVSRRPAVREVVGPMARFWHERGRPLPACVRAHLSPSPSHL